MNDFLHNHGMIYLCLQVFQYDSSQSCLSLEFGFFVLFGLLVVVGFVIPAPVVVGYVCTARSKVIHLIDESS